MSTATRIDRSLAVSPAAPRAASGTAPRPSAPLAPSSSPVLARRVATQLGQRWLPRVAWSLHRTGRTGLVGLGLLLGAATFLVSTHLQVLREIASLRADLATARLQPPGPAATPAASVASSTSVLRALPDRSEMPEILRQLFDEAARARLSVRSATYEASPVRSGGVVRYQIAFPVTGPYPQIRAFLDATLAAMPAVALRDLVLERRSIGDGNVEAQIRLTVYTRSAP